ncbi:MAG: 3-methylcrotonyl-CoA carboxylase, partial [Rhodobacteraceae bacterium]|nr:3-methylcrotonyl-CoA carboxylase [Paracoccaceae bacterium]
MFDTILIANRGEIAVRVMQTAQRMGLTCVAVYSDADAGAKHVRMADHAVHIGGPAPKDSYLRGDAIIAAALQTGAGAIHPGYGFLSENPDFVDAVQAAGLTFIGPSADAIRAMGL